MEPELIPLRLPALRRHLLSMFYVTVMRNVSWITVRDNR